MPQNPGLYTPTPPAGQILAPVLSQSTSILSAILFRSKQEERSVYTSTDEPSPIIDQGSIYEGTF